MGFKNWRVADSPRCFVPMKKKIMFACHGIGNGGAERVLLTLANNFAKRGYEVSIVTTNEPHNDYAVNESVKRFICYPNQKNAFARIFARLRYVRKFIKSENPDCIVSFSANINVQILIGAIGLGKKIIVSERTDPSRYPESKIGRFIRTLSYRLADLVVFQTEDAKNYFPEYIRCKSRIIHNPICINIPEDASIPKENLIIGVGSLGEQKNWKMALAAFSVFSKRHPDYRLEIYGEGPQKEELDIFIKQDVNLKGKALLMGFSNEITKRLLQSKIYVSSSVFEGISNSMLEALALGTPTICTDCPVGGAKMFIKNEVNGLLVPVNDVEAMILAMNKLADDEEFASMLSAKSVNIRKELSVDKIIDIWESVVCIN